MLGEPGIRNQSLKLGFQSKLLICQSGEQQAEPYVSLGAGAGSSSADGNPAWLECQHAGSLHISCDMVLGAIADSSSADGFPTQQHLYSAWGYRSQADPGLPPGIG